MPEKESLSQDYFPSAKLRLIIRFEEFGRVQLVKSKAPVKLAHTLRGTTSTRGAMTVEKDPTAPAGTTRYLVLPASGAASGGPQKEDASTDQLTWPIGGIIPKDASWKLNGIRTASELKTTIKFVDMPFDPRCIRSCAVEYYLGTLAERDYFDGVGGAVRGASDRNGAGGESLLILPDQWVDQNGRIRTNLRFQGWVDEWEVEWPDEDEPRVTLTCRDNTKVLIDQEAPHKLVIAANKPIDEAIAAYIANFPQCAGLSVEYRPGGIDPPKLGPALAKTAFKPKLGPTPTGGGGGGGSSSKLSVWDYLTDVCGSLGQIIRMDGTVIVVQEPRSLLSTEAPARADDPFTTRTVAGLTMQHRHFIYGRNVKNYKIARRFGKQAPQNVEVRSYSTLRKTMLVERYPLKGQSIVTDANPGDGHSEQKYLVWRVQGITDRKVLRVIAQSVYETVGRNELSVNIQTHNLASFGGDNTDPDILDMKVGDPVELLVARDQDYNSLTNIEQNMLIAESGKLLLEAAGYSAGIADAYAKVYGDSGFQSTFRTRDFAVDWSIEDGVAITVGAVNYIEVRADKVLPQGEQQLQNYGGSSVATNQKQPGTT